MASNTMMLTGGPQSFKDLGKQMTTSSVFKAVLQDSDVGLSARTH
jgi:hypothetical protein